jgi:uncharacterized protein YfiM (DUF2279 family)
MMMKAMLAAALLGGQAANVTAPARCITRAEVGDLTLVGASITVEVVRNACRTHLPETAFLATPAGAEFSGRLRAEGQHRLESALNGAGRLAGDNSGMSQAAVRTFVRGMMTEGAGTDFAQYADASLCRDANEILEIASTLSPDQMARFVGAFASIADHAARMQPPHIAPHPAPPPAVLTPHPAAFEAPRRRASPPVMITPTPRRAPFAPFLCQPE